MIYFVRHPKRKRIKIGTTNKLTQRLGTLSCQHGVKLVVLAVMDGGREEEKAIHERFKHLRLDGEWFKPESDLEEFIQVECRPWDGSNEVPVGQLIRVSDELAQLLRCIATLEGCTVLDVADRELLPIVQRHYRDSVLAEAKRLGYEV